MVNVVLSRLPLIDVSKLVPSTAGPDRLSVTTVGSNDLALSVAVMIPVPPASGIVKARWAQVLMVGPGGSPWLKTIVAGLPAGLAFVAEAIAIVDEIWGGP